MILTVKWAWAVKNKGLKLFQKLWTPNGTQQWVTFVIINVWHRTNNLWKSVGNIPHKPMSFHALWVASSEVTWFACYCLCWSTTGLFSLCRVHKSNHYSPYGVTENEAYFLPLRWIIVISLQLIKSFVSRLHHIAARRIYSWCYHKKYIHFIDLVFVLVSIQFFASKWLFRQCNEACCQLTIAFLSLQLTFTVKSVQQDVLCITVFDRDLFSPNGKF